MKVSREDDLAPVDVEEVMVQNVVGQDYRTVAAHEITKVKSEAAEHDLAVLDRGGGGDGEEVGP